MSRPKALFLVGPTASGKTGLAISLQARFPLELISVDSALIYRDMDIGTAKPTADELRQAPHHLIDILSPLDSYSAARFASDARALMDDIVARGRIPLLVGGTMLYYRALSAGLSDLPQADATIRAEIDHQAALHGWPAIHAELAAVDPVTAARLAPNDSQRLQRALEVWRISGTPMSAFHQQSQSEALPYDVLKLALWPQERAWLHERIERRFQLMLEAGFLDEVRALRSKYPGLHADLPSIRCVGYRQAWSLLDGQCDQRTFVEQGVAATRQLAKRQLTWMRSMPDLLRLDCQQPLLEPASAAVARFLAE